MELRTIKLDITKYLTDSQIIILKHTADECKGVFEMFVDLAKKYKSCSYPTLHKYGYEKVKELYPDLPTGLLQTSAKTALIACKSWNSNNPKKKWKFKISRKANTIDLNVLTLSRRSNLTTISTTNKRIRIMHEIPSWFIERYSKKNGEQSKLQAGKIKILSDGTVILYLSYQIKNNKPVVGGKIIGIDRGLYNLCSTSDGEIFNVKRYIAVKRRYQHLRSQLQQKGTKSAKRKLKKLSGKERRFMLDVNHQITKKLANRNDISVYVLEDLSDIRQKKRGKKLNSWISNWSFYEFERLLEYKCRENGILVVKTNPSFTSQRCSLCGVIDSTARNKGRYICPHCGYIEHADINAAKNICYKYVQSLKLEQADFNQLNVGFEFNELS